MNNPKLLPERAKRGKRTANVVIETKSEGQWSKSTKSLNAPQNAPLSKQTYLKMHHATAMERISMIRHGVTAYEAKRIFDDVPMRQGDVFRALNLSAATVNRKAKQGGTLSRDESERVLGFAKLVGQLEAMIEESGDPAGFNAQAWIARWLTEPLPAFGGVRPADLMDTMEGQGLVSAALAMVQSGAYA